VNAVLAYIDASDHRISDRVWAWRPPRLVRHWMLWASRLGDGGLWAMVGLVLLMGGGPGYRLAACGALAGGLASALLVPLKRRFRRRRPCEAGLHPLYNVRPLEYLAADHFSFPSGHSMNAFAIATAVGLGLPALLPALLFAAASVAASRVVLGLHYVSDVLAGSLLGAVIGTTVFLVVLG
jgi:undecaprenyl-diphosphatase